MKELPATVERDHRDAIYDRLVPMGRPNIPTSEGLRPGPLSCRRAS